MIRKILPTRGLSGPVDAALQSIELKLQAFLSPAAEQFRASFQSVAPRWRSPCKNRGREALLSQRLLRPARSQLPAFLLLRKSRPKPDTLEMSEQGRSEVPEMQPVASSPLE